MAQVSERGKILPASPIRKLTPLADAAKRRGIHVHHLNIGQPETHRTQHARIQSFGRIVEPA